MNKIMYKTLTGEIENYPIFYGRTTEELPRIISKGYKPISIKEIMEQRIKACDYQDNTLVDMWCKNNLDSGDSIIYNPDGRIKIVPNSETLRNLLGENQVDFSKLLISEEGIFDNSQGYEFSREEVKKFAGRYLKKEETLENPIWLSLVREDKNLLKEYVDRAYSKINDPELMRIFLSHGKQDFETERYLCLDGLSNYSNLNGALDFSNNILIDDSDLFRLRNKGVINHLNCKKDSCLIGVLSEEDSNNISQKKGMKLQNLI